VGNPLIDTIMQVDDAAPKKCGVVAGSMNLVDSDKAQFFSGYPAKSKKLLPGGSCANTMRGIAILCKNNPELGTSFYSGAIGKDKNGEIFSKLMRDLGISTSLAEKEGSTGNSHIFVTPDHERTMFTHLGSSSLFSYEDIDKEALQSCRFFHFTGYMWDTENQKEALKRGSSYVRSMGGKVSFDIADPFVVRLYREDLITWMPKSIDILFTNLEELSFLTEIQNDRLEMLETASMYADIVILKAGAEGCMIRKGGETISIPSFPIIPVDTTGAGDSFAAGFLYGMLKGMSLYECGKIANRIASYIVTVEGCDFHGLPRQMFR
jgi:sugar/nucleoside kinase (ribokinase family)